MSKCRSCGAEIVWIKMESGKSMPCDRELVTFISGGGPQTFVTPAGKVERGRRSNKGDLTGYISHFATCPNANQHRRR